jgi:hypothetical protein
MPDTDFLLLKYRIPSVNHNLLIDGMRVNRLFGLRDLIEENVTKEFVVCEIGSYRGVSSTLFANYCKMIYCVDTFCEVEYDAIFDYNASFYKNIVKVKNNSVEASELFDDFSLDLVYLDASHDYNDVYEDIVHWQNKIKTDGYLSGHDYHNQDSSVVEVLDDLKIIPDKIYEDSSWIKRM